MVLGIDKKFETLSIHEYSHRKLVFRLHKMKTNVFTLSISDVISYSAMRIGTTVRLMFNCNIRSPADDVTNLWRSQSARSVPFVVTSRRATFFSRPDVDVLVVMVVMVAVVVPVPMHVRRGSGAPG